MGLHLAQKTCARMDWGFSSGRDNPDSWKDLVQNLSPTELSNQVDRGGKFVRKILGLENTLQVRWQDHITMK